VNAIRYAQCWEDPASLTAALDIQREDDVVSIGSAGDNTFALLLDQPRSVTVVDMNPAQLYLIELKIRAMETFDYDDFVAFIGARPACDRRRLYRLLRGALSDPARAYWDADPTAIGQGVTHCGKFEKYFAYFRQLILPLVHSQADVHKLLSLTSVDQQQAFYHHVWNHRRWRWLFQLFFGKILLGNLGRDPSCFKHVQLRSIAEELLGRVARAMNELPVGDNYFLEYILTGKYRDLAEAHPYLRQENFQHLKDSVGSVRLIEGSLGEYLRTLPSGSLSKLNLSDIFEYMSPAALEATLNETLRACRDQARIAFWSLFVSPIVPPSLADKIRVDDRQSREFFARDRTFFYGGFHLWHCRSSDRPLGDPNVIGASQ
jgi:S-adenosylmethionine-diacylglycerol 3-amino-3-carboxypropyl transferase